MLFIKKGGRYENFGYWQVFHLNNCCVVFFDYIDDRSRTWHGWLGSGG
jgi:hypothetical protein